MTETRRLLEAAAALSNLLTESGVPHAFYGSLLTATLSNSPQSSEILCIVESGQYHPFRRVREAVAGNADFTSTNSPWTNRFGAIALILLQATYAEYFRFHVTYRRLIPSIDIEILVAGEAGPRRLDATTTTKISGVPFLTISEFIRAKLKTWIIRGTELDAQDITYMISRYWNRVDINRIPEADMNQFTARNPVAAPAWAAIRKKYGL